MKLAGPLLAVLLLSFRGFAQLPDRSATLRLTQELRTAVQNDSFNASVDLVTRLDESVRALHRASLVRDSRERVAEVLSWLPADTESLWVNQEPFTIVSGEPAQ
ncbi:MAG: hypothetical protein JWP63_897, partial [Candidatus Solibacter sp.]|nr:hypothetical protein [Candidatus Solibacter sp.]